MNITFSKVSIPLRGNIVDLCLEFQKKGVVVSIVYGSYPDIRFHLPQDLPAQVELLNIRPSNRQDVEEYTFRDMNGVVSVVYGREYAELYHPPKLTPVNHLLPSQPMVTFHNKNFAKSFHHYPEDVIEVEIKI